MYIHTQYQPHAKQTDDVHRGNDAPAAAAGVRRRRALCGTSSGLATKATRSCRLRLPQQQPNRGPRQQVHPAARHGTHAAGVLRHLRCQRRLPGRCPVRPGVLPEDQGSADRSADAASRRATGRVRLSRLEPVANASTIADTAIPAVSAVSAVPAVSGPAGPAAASSACTRPARPA